MKQNMALLQQQLRLSIKAEIRELTKSNEEYPTVVEIASFERVIQWVPESLQLLLLYLIPPKLQQLSVGQCIVQAAKSMTGLCPIPLGLGV